MSFLADLKAALREVFKPEPWPEPPRDETTPKLIAEWVAANKHPDKCRVGCQCEKGERR